MAIGKARKNFTGNEKSKMKRLTFADLFVPILSLMIFILLTIFVYIPMVQDAVKMRDEIREVQRKQSVLQNNVDVLKPFAENKLLIQQDLKTSRDVIPNSLDVADFTYYVDKLARDSGLKFREISSGNITVNSVGVQNQSVASNVSGVSGPIVYEGTYNEIVDFLDQLQKESPYIIETSSVKLNRIQSADKDKKSNKQLWSVELNLTGYYISQTNEFTTIDLYNPIAVYTQFQDVLDIFKYKASKLQAASR